MASDNNVTSELKRLLSLIGKEVEVAERYIFPAGEDTRTVEQLCDPLLRTSIHTIEAACAQLCCLVARPSDILANKFLAFFEPACLQVALSNKIPDIIEESPSGVHISELGSRTGVDEGKLGRVLRLLAAKHVFQEVAPGTFANNRLSKHLVSRNRLAGLGLGLTSDCFKAASSLSDTLNDPTLTASTSPLDSAFSKHFGLNNHFFHDSAGSTEHERLASDFDDRMIGWSSVVEANAVVYDFPWNQLPAGTSVCDVGGGIGDISLQLAKRYPRLHLVLQDLPKQVDYAEKKFWPERGPEAIAECRVDFIPLDFFKQSPKEYCDIYFLKNILHDWNDEDCIKILTNVKKVMGKSSRILIHEFVVLPGYRVAEGDAKFTQAPEPLLPNYGEGRIRQYIMDVNMMVVFNSRERTLEEFIYLGRSAGLEFVKLWETGEMALIEFVLQQCRSEEGLQSELNQAILSR